MAGLDGEFITAFVLRVAGVAGDVFEGDLVDLAECVQFFPVLDVFDRFPAALGFAPPVVPLPVFDPFGDALDDVGTIGDDVDAGRPFEFLESLDDRLQLHLVIGGVGPPAAGLQALAGGHVGEDESPTPGAGIAAARAVGVENHFG